MEREPMYPESRRTDEADIIHGVRVYDPYQWLEELHLKQSMRNTLTISRALGLS